MKILQINTEKNWRGGERQTLLTLQGLKLAGVDVSLLCLDNQPLDHEAKKHSLPVVSVPGQMQAYKYLLTHGKGFDLLHAQTSKAQSLAILSKPVHRSKVVYTRRVDFCPRGFTARIKYRFTDQLVAISLAIRNILETSFPGRDIRVIPSCIDAANQASEPGRKARELKKKHAGLKIIATAAALVPHKDPLTLVRAVAKFKRDSGRSFVFLHFGQGELESVVRSEIHKLGLEQEYLLMGFVEDLEEYFPVFDLFVMSSREEGLGSSVLEAFKHQVPVVSTVAGGLEELLSGRGLLCPVQDHECLARSMVQVISSPGDYQEMVQEAKHYVFQEHSLEVMARRYVSLYREILS